MPEAKLKETWTAVLNKVGAFESAGKTRAIKRDVPSGAGQNTRTGWSGR